MKTNTPGTHPLTKLILQGNTPSKEINPPGRETNPPGKSPNKVQWYQIQITVESINLRYHLQQRNTHSAHELK